MQATGTGPSDAEADASSQLSHARLKERLAAECADLVTRAQAATSTSDLEGAFAAFLGSYALDDLQAVSNQSLIDGRRLKKLIRQELAPLYRRSGVWRHCVERPFGYPGDYTILEHVYDRSPHPRSADDVGKLLDLWSLSTELPLAVQGRKDALRLYLQELADRARDEGRVVQVLSIACGGAREIRELARRAHPQLELTLVDRDPRALEFAASSLRTLPDLKFRTIAADALAASGDDALVGDRRYDLVYSFGLFDYLKDDLIVQCVNRFTPHLAADGRFVFCLKDQRHYHGLFYDLFLDWRFIPRVRDSAPPLIAQTSLEITGRMTIEGSAVNIYECHKRA